MYEVTDKNFEELYPKIEETLKKAVFLAIDTEFSGLKTDFFVKESLFDSPDERYVKVKNNIQPFIIIQFGFTAFHHIREKNAYGAETFNFYLLPRSIPTKNRHFVWQITALEFLAVYKFDFNKFAYTGISYLDEADEIELRNELHEDILMRHLERFISNKDSDELRDSRNKVADWLRQKTEPYAAMEIETDSPFLQYLMHKELRYQFPDIWTYPGKRKVIVIKVAKDERHDLEVKEGDELDQTLLDYYIGFSKVFKLMVTLKKPIVGHNVLTDLMYMHQQFYKSLPKKYTEFKENIHRLFPLVYDTKLLSYELRKTLQKEEKFANNALNTLYYYFKDARGKHLTLNSPLICSVDNSTLEVDSFHDAGWDSYCAGYCFIKMAHTFAVKKRGTGSHYKPMTNIEIMNGVTPFVNHINIIRGNVSFLNLGGPDPISVRPEWLFVEALGKKTICASEIAELLSSFGNVDVKPFSSKRALVAVANHASARDILKHFKSNADIYIGPYNSFRHSPAAKLFMWGGVIISGGIIALMLQYKSRL
ncbi:pre-piRNA 3'-exonuclease trimmer-like [Belonocnema kinseyi]|uniref:pre-piRNA 3'-exonuclease trimmer-like n=1 Tax=Belonocnema kinseyi TaxID=2817044 RepID=UPI00143DC5C0|nr:pre-piRNA 3'-exonuclease trimmer-like [Belonocnema kinseyi]